MAINTTTTHSSQYRTYFDRKLLAHAVHTIVLAQLARKEALPPHEGAKTVQFFRPQVADASTVSSLTEGTPLATSTDQTYSAVSVTLAQVGQYMQWSDILTQTAFLKVLDDGVRFMGETCALKCDDVVMAALSHASTGFSKRYSGGAANYAALLALSNANGKLVGDDILDATTTLRINKTPTIGGQYVGVLGPQIARDLMRDTNWTNSKVYSDVQDLYNAEEGTLYDVRFVRTTNPWGEDATEGTRDDTSPPIWSTYIFGHDAFGVVDLASMSPMRPHMYILDTADKSDKLNQYVTAGWKAYYAALVLNPNFGITLRSRSLYA